MGISPFDLGKMYKEALLPLSSSFFHLNWHYIIVIAFEKASLFLLSSFSSPVSSPSSKKKLFGWAIYGREAREAETETQI